MQDTFRSFTKARWESEQNAERGLDENNWGVMRVPIIAKSISILFF
jgi:hypothetical protein